MKLTTQQIINAAGFALLNPKNHFIGNNVDVSGNRFCPHGLCGLIETGYAYDFGLTNSSLLNKLNITGAKWDSSTNDGRLEIARMMYEYREV